MSVNEMNPSGRVDEVTVSTGQTVTVLLVKICGMGEFLLRGEWNER